jgi:hypothetical protein
MSIINNDDPVRESTSVDEYKQFTINILEEIYKFNSEENEKIIGNKNKEQPYELQIKNILDKNCIEKKTFIYNNSIVIDDKKKISITDSYYIQI